METLVYYESCRCCAPCCRRPCAGVVCVRSPWYPEAGVRSTVNPPPGLGGLRIPHTIVVLVLLAQHYLLAMKQNHTKVGSRGKGIVTVVVYV